MSVLWTSELGRTMSLGWAGLVGGRVALGKLGGVGVGLYSVYWVLMGVVVD